MPGSLKQLGRIDYALTDFDTPLQTGEIFGGGPTGRWKWGKIGEYDDNGQSYELLDEGLGIAGMRAVKLNVARTLKFKHAEYASNTRKSRSMFTRVALKEGPVDPADLIDAYITANKALWKVQKEMNANMDAAYTLGTSPATVRDSLARMSTRDFALVKGGYFKPYSPSKDVRVGIYKNARKLGLPTPLNSTTNKIINNILRQLSTLKTGPGSEFPDFVNPLRAVGSRDQSSITPNIPVETSEVSEEVVRTSALPQNINPNTGLTRIDEALLSNEEKAMRLRQKGLTA